MAFLGRVTAVPCSTLAAYETAVTGECIENQLALRLVGALRTGVVEKYSYAPTGGAVPE